MFFIIFLLFGFFYTFFWILCHYGMAFLQTIGSQIKISNIFQLTCKSTSVMRGKIWSNVVLQIDPSHFGKAAKLMWQKNFDERSFWAPRWETAGVGDGILHLNDRQLFTHPGLPVAFNSIISSINKQQTKTFQPSSQKSNISTSLRNCNTKKVFGILRFIIISHYPGHLIINKGAIVSSLQDGILKMVPFL